MILKRLYACALWASVRSVSDTCGSVIIRYLPKQETNSVLFLISIPDHSYNCQYLIIMWVIYDLTIIWVIDLLRTNPGVEGWLVWPYCSSNSIPTRGCFNGLILDKGTPAALQNWIISVSVIHRSYVSVDAGNAAIRSPFPCKPRRLEFFD